MPPAHPSSCPCGRNPRRRRARPAASDRHHWTDAEPLLCVAQPGKRIVAVEPPGTRRARVVREVVRCIRPIARAASTVCASGRHWWTDAEPLPCVAQPGKRIVAVKLPGTRRARVVRCIRPIARAASAACGFRPSLVDGRGVLSCVAQPGKRIVAVEPPGTRRARVVREVVREVVRCIRPIARAASTASGRSQWTDAKTFREPRGRESEGYVRRCFTSPAHPSSCPCGRNPWRRARFALQAVIGGRTRSLCCASRSRGKESSQWNCPERAGREWYAASVQLPGRRVGLQAVLNGRTRSLSVSRAAGK